METLINKKVIFNPLSKTHMTTSVIPVCDYWNDTGSTAPIEQRNAMVDIYGNEILNNGGQLQVQDNGDLYVTRNSEEAYSDSSVDTFITKDWYFMNISLSERDIMSDYEYSEKMARTRHQILKRYLSEEEATQILTDPERYYEKIREIEDHTATVVTSIEASLQQWLDLAFGDSLNLLKSNLIKKIFKLIKIRQLSISAYTELRTWLFGVAKNQYPFIYFKTTGIYDMGKLSNQPQRLTDIDMSPYDPSEMNVYQKEITSNKKNLMTVCKWMNTEYQCCPEGYFKNWIYNDPVHTNFVGNFEDIFQGINIETIQHSDYIEYNVGIDNNSASNHLKKIYERYIYDKVLGMKFSTDYSDYEPLVGVVAQRDNTTQSKYYNEYGVTVPISKTMCQHQQIIKFQEGEKLVIYFSFLKDTNFGTNEDSYFEPLARGGAAKGNVRYVGQAKIQTHKAYQTTLDYQPLITVNDFKGDFNILNKEMWNRQDFTYDETYINDGFTKGDFLFMTGNSQTSSAGYIGIKLRLSMEVPYSAYKPTNVSRIEFLTTRKTIQLKQIMAIQDLEDTYQIKDTIASMKCEMLSKFYGMLDMYVRNNLELDDAASKAIPQRMIELVHYGALRRCLRNVSWYDERIFLRDVLPTKDRRISQVFVKEFDIRDEQIDYFPTVKDVNKSEYAYELKTFAEAKSQNQAYTTNTRVQFIPMNIPFDMKDMTKSTIEICFNALVPTVTADMDLGGGLLAKINYRLMEDVYLKYIVSKSREFKSGLSNSELIRFEVNTFNTLGLDKLYENQLPTTKKDIGITLRRMTKYTEHDKQEGVYKANNLITNIMYDHNYLTQTDNIRMNLTIQDND